MSKRGGGAPLGFIWEMFVKERNDALLSLDRGRIEGYLRKWGIGRPKDDRVFWLGVHKAIANIEDAPEEARKASLAWLAEHGSNPGGAFGWLGGLGDDAGGAGPEGRPESAPDGGGPAGGGRE